MSEYLRFLTANIGVLTASLLLTACHGNNHENVSRDTLSGHTHRVTSFHAMSDHTHEKVYVTQTGHIEFFCEAYGTVGIFMGESNSLKGIIDFRKNRIAFSLNFETLKTGIAPRDQVLHQALDVDQYPVAEFTGTFKPSFDQNSFERQTITASGQFTVHGITHDLEVDGYLQNHDHGVILIAEWILNITDYDITPPRKFNVEIHEEQEVRIEAGLVPQLLTSLSGTGGV